MFHIRALNNTCII